MSRQSFHTGASLGVYTLARCRKKPACLDVRNISYVYTRGVRCCVVTAVLLYLVPKYGIVCRHRSILGPVLCLFRDSRFDGISDIWCRTSSVLVYSSTGEAPEGIRHRFWILFSITVSNGSTTQTLLSALLPLRNLIPPQRGPFRTAVPFWGQTSQISSSLSPKRDCGSKAVKLGIFAYIFNAWCIAVHINSRRQGSTQVP